MWAVAARRENEARRYGNSIVAGRSTQSLSSTVTSDAGWVLFRKFDDPGSAEVVCAWLLREGVPAKIIRRTLESQLEAEYGVFVDSRLAHRARWVAAQLPPTDEELDYLATGELPGGKARTSE